MMAEMELPEVKGISDDWVYACRAATYRFYLAAAERRFDDLDAITHRVLSDWCDIHGNWTQATLPDAHLASMGLDERLVKLCESLGVFTITDLDRADDETFLAVPNVADKIVFNLREFSRLAWAAVQESRA